jgi:hypothetical protein
MNAENKTATYSKYCPNVWLAKCDEPCKKNEIINVVTQYGKVNESIVHNLVFEKDGYYFYSITRADGYNLQERAKRKAEQYENWADSAQKKSNAYYEAANEGADFLVLAEPIKIGHHSEKRHRALIERNYNRMANSVKNANKAEQHEYKAKAWEKRTEDINLSIPESLEYFKDQYEKAKEYHQLLKAKPELREHAYSLTYAKKKVNEMKKNYDTAVILWG